MDDAKQSGLDRLIEALTIFKKYGRGSAWPTNCDHDVFAVCDGITKEEVSPEDAERLDSLGFSWSDSSDCWVSFSFGSC